MGEKENRPVACAASGTASTCDYDSTSVSAGQDMTENELIRTVTENYLAGIDMDDRPAPEQVERELLQATNNDIEAYNLGSQVPNEEFLRKAAEVNADVLLVSQTVTQKDVHIQNLTELIELAEAEGVRDKYIFCCGGARITHALAKELGYDAGFGAGTYADDVATFCSKELVRRLGK